MNGARAGPFGGVVPVQMAGAADAGAANGTADAGAGTGANTGNTGTGNTGNSNAASSSRAAKNARRALARSVRDAEAKRARLQKKAVALAQDLADPDTLAEVLEDCE